MRKIIAMLLVLCLVGVLSFLAGRGENDTTIIMLQWSEESTQVPTTEPRDVPDAPENSVGPSESAAPSESVGETEPAPSEDGENLVWIPTKGGTKYHSRKDCSNMDAPLQVPLSVAEAEGFTPCKRCH